MTARSSGRAREIELPPRGHVLVVEGGAPVAAAEWVIALRLIEELEPLQRVRWQRGVREAHYLKNQTSAAARDRRCHGAARGAGARVQLITERR